MKKIIVGFVVIIGMSLFNSCTDNTLEEVENRELQSRLEYSEKDEEPDERD